MSGAARQPSRAGASAAVAFLTAGYVALALAYRSAIPLFEGPDEPSHLHYAVFVYENGRLPREQPQEVPGEGMQPPLAYLAAAPLFARTGLDASQVAQTLHAVGAYVYGFDFSSPGSTAVAFVPNGQRIFYSDGSLGALTALRSTSLAFGLFAVLLTFAAAWRATGDPRLALLAGALLAFSPQFLFVSSYFSNDPAATAVGAAALCAVVDAIARGGPARGHYAACAVVIALGLLTKINTVPGLAVAAATLAWIDHRPARERARDAVLAAGLVLALAGPYLVWSLGHGRGLLGLGAVSASASWLHVPAGQLREHLFWTYWSLSFQSYWCRFGWMTVGAPGFVVGAFAALSAAGVIGFFLDRTSALRRYLLASIAATGAAHLALNFAVVSAQGRQLFPIAPQVALVLALGLARLFGGRRRLAAVLVPVTALLALDVYCLLRVLAPAYGDLAVSRIETDEPSPVGIPARVLNELCEHAREAEPEECCGLVLSEGELRYGRAVRCRNEMTRRHEEDPEEFPRDSRSAYYMSARDVLAVAREAERSGEAVTAVYHSHVGAGAYLSEVDLSYASHALFPFPFADQIVLSVYERSVREIKLFVRSDGRFSERLMRAEAS